MDLKGTKTQENLRAALAGESLARNKYTFYAMSARQAGLDQLAAALERMAKNEMMHAKFWFEQLYGKPEDARLNLMEAIKGELAEADTMYPEFAKQARQEGMEDLAKMFESVARIEADHARQFMRMLREITSAEEQKKDEEELPAAQEPQSGYRCMFCGAVFPQRPDVCGVCQAIGSFEVC